MIIVYVLCYLPNVTFSSGTASLSVPIERINYSWELYEGLGLADYCRVQFVPANTSPPAVKPDLVYSSQEGSAPFASKLAQRWGVPLVSEVISRPADYPDPNGWDEYKMALSRAETLIGVSPVVYKGLKETFPGKRVYMNPHGVNDKIADSIKEASERDGFMAISVLMGHKRVEWLLEAFMRLKKENLRIIGGGPERSSLEVLNKIWCEPANFLKAVDDHRKFQELKKCKGLLSASKSEQFWIPGAEALYCCVPVIAYNMVNVRELYGEANGAMEYFETVEELMDLIEKYDDMSSEEVRKIGGRGREFVLEKGMKLTQRSKRLYEILVEAREGWKT